MNKRPVFDGAHFQSLIEQAPLNGATVFRQGSNSMLFECSNRLYRLTLEGCGHNFLVQEWAKGNRNVVEIIHDYGAVAPSDASSYDNRREFYWLAEVERLESLDEHSEPLLVDLMAGLLDENDELPASDLLVERCHSLAKAYPVLAGVFTTLGDSAVFAERHEGDVDAKLDNIMRRPATGELVWTDPLGGYLYES